MTDPVRLRKMFRIACNRRGTVRPIASIGLSRDGGIMVAPVAVPGQRWRYGTASASGFEGEPVETDDRPKLHYHRSGIAAVSLTGRELQRRSLRLPPIPSVSRGQILSIVAVRPWELAVGSDRKGDIFDVEATWPQEIGWTFQLLRYRGTLPPIDEGMESFAPMGLLAGDDSRWYIDMSWYMAETVLVGQSHPSYTPTRHLLPSITVAALPWSADRSEANKGVFALWSSELRNPEVAHSNSDRVLTEEDFAERFEGGQIFSQRVEDGVTRIFGDRPHDQSPPTLPWLPIP